jgi:hypothetical protein
MEEVANPAATVFWVTCPRCSQRYSLCVGLRAGLRIRCSNCGASFQAGGGKPDTPPSRETPKDAPRKGPIRQGGLPRRAWASAGLLALGAIALCVYQLTHRSSLQWKVTAEGGHGKATLSLYGTSPGQIERVQWSIRGGALSRDPTWSHETAQAWTLKSPLSVGGRKGVAVRFANGESEGEAWIDPTGHAFVTVTRARTEGPRSVWTGHGAGRLAREGGGP